MNENNRNITPTPKPTGWIYAYGFTNTSEAPPPPPAPPAPVVATSRFQGERFVLPHPEDAAPLFPILGRSTDNESTPRIGYSIVPIPSENVALFDEEKMEEVEDRNDNDTDNGSATTRALLGKRKEVGATVASNTKPCDNQLQTLEPSSSESSATPILPLLPCGDHLPSSNHRYHQAKSKPFLKQRKAKTKSFDELIDETVKA